MSASGDLFNYIREADGANYDAVVACDWHTYDYINSLIDTSTLEVIDKDFIRSRLIFIEWNYQAHMLISYLKHHQPDAILSGNNYSQTDILNHLDKL